MRSLAGTVDNKGPLQTYPSNFRYEIHVIFLAKSEDILPASSQLQKFFKGTFALELRKSIKSHILKKKKKKLDNIILSVIFQSFTSQINV